MTKMYKTSSIIALVAIIFVTGLVPGYTAQAATNYNTPKAFAREDYCNTSRKMKDNFDEKYYPIYRELKGLLNGNTEVNGSWYALETASGYTMDEIIEFSQEYQQMYLLDNTLPVDAAVENGKVTAQINVTLFKKYYKSAKPIYSKLTKAVKKMKISKKTMQTTAIYKINEYICKYMTYELNQSDFRTAIKTKKGNCFAYATFFKYLCARVGIDANIVYGYSVYGGSHSWNKVTFSKSKKMRYVDVCWDDSANKKTAYCMLTKKKMSKTHIFGL